jgi:hypothetical protein
MVYLQRPPLPAVEIGTSRLPALGETRQRLVDVAPGVAFSGGGSQTSAASIPSA